MLAEPHAAREVCRFLEHLLRGAMPSANWQGYGDEGSTGWKGQFETYGVVFPDGLPPGVVAGEPCGRPKRSWLVVRDPEAVRAWAEPLIGKEAYGLLVLDQTLSLMAGSP